MAAFSTTVITGLDPGPYDQVAGGLGPAPAAAPGVRSHVRYRCREDTVTISLMTPGEGETISAGPMTLRILEDGARTGHRIGVVEISIPPGIDGPPQHIHRRHDETFYVIAGSPTFTCGTDVITATPGALVTAPPGSPHTFGNPGDEPAVILCTVTPDLYIDYFRELDRLPKGPSGLDHAAVAEIMRRYATETFRP